MAVAVLIALYCRRGLGANVGDAGLGTAMRELDGMDDGEVQGPG